MTLAIKECINIDKREQGEKLYKILDELSIEEKRAIIWFKCNEGEVPTDIDLSDDTECARIESTLNALANFGTSYINEHDFADTINDLAEDYEEILNDGEAWDVLTRLEISNHKKYEECYFEAHLSESGEQITEVGVDLIGSDRNIDLITCKFNISTQHFSACRRLSELTDVSECIEQDTQIGIGTLAFKLEAAIIGDIIQHSDDIDLSESDIGTIITGIDIFDLRR